MAKHHRDIKIYYANRNIRDNMRIHGFQSYSVQNIDGAMQKSIIPGVPATFNAGNIEDGYMVSWVSDTEKNRQIIKSLQESRVLFSTDDRLTAPTIAPTAPLSPTPVEASGEAFTREYAESLSNDELKMLLKKQGVSYLVRDTKEELIRRLLQE